MQTEIPVVDVILIPTNRVGEERHWLVIKCAYCGRQHRHGAGKPSQNPTDHLGSRWSHCGAPFYYGRGGEYELRWIQQEEAVEI